MYDLKHLAGHREEERVEIRRTEREGKVEEEIKKGILKENKTGLFKIEVNSKLIDVESDWI